ncbi:hypothetical protein AB0F68_30455 [Micromonospora sp. NPDC023966]
MTSARELMAGGGVPGRQLVWILIACTMRTAIFAPLLVRLLRTR